MSEHFERMNKTVFCFFVRARHRGMQTNVAPFPRMDGPGNKKLNSSTTPPMRSPASSRVDGGHVHVGTHQALCNHPLRRFPQILTIDLLKHSSRPLQILKNIFQKIDLPSVLLLTMTGFSVTRWTDYCLIFGNFRR